MHISVFGMGYVGAVCAACWSKEGHNVVGVDVNSNKVDMINQGLSPIIEQQLPEMIAEAVASGWLRATTDANEAVLNTAISLVCVGTPSQLNGNLDLHFLRNVCEQIGSTLKSKSSFHVIVIRSTVLPGTVREILIPTLEQYSGKTVGRDFGVAFNPEFLREGSAIDDFYHPPKSVIGATDARSSDIVTTLYEAIDAPLIKLSLDSAEMVKYTDNAWHAAKIVFANEIGNLCKAFNIDSHQVMDAFCLDTKLNLSANYLKPGFAFGGSCLPKDVRALCYRAKTHDLNVPLLQSLLPSNQQQIERVVELIQSQASNKVGLLGLSFKLGTDDLRESPMVELAERLLGKGYELKIHDQNVSLAKIAGANKDYLLNKIPHISRLLAPSLDDVVNSCDVLVAGNRYEDVIGLVDTIRADQVLIDLVRLCDRSSSGNYIGIGW